VKARFAEAVPSSIAGKIDAADAPQLEPGKQILLALVGLAFHDRLSSYAFLTLSFHFLLQAKRTLLTRHESDLKDNSYWLSLMTHVQTPSVHRKVSPLP
jgi:hypothetical protein